MYTFDPCIMLLVEETGKKWIVFGKCLTKSNFVLKRTHATHYREADFKISCPYISTSNCTKSQTPNWTFNIKKGRDKEVTIMKCIKFLILTF